MGLDSPASAIAEILEGLVTSEISNFLTDEQHFCSASVTLKVESIIPGYFEWMLRDRLMTLSFDGKINPT